MEQEDATFLKIKKIISFCLSNKYSTFYRNKYKKDRYRSKSVKSYEDFQKIPFLTKEEIATVPPLKRLFVSEEKVGCWVRTSGTTSNAPLLIPASFLQSEHLDVLASILEQVKVRKILSIRPFGMLTIDLFDFSSHKKLSSYTSILGDISNLDLVAKMASGIEIDGIDTTPSALYYLIPYLKEKYDLAKIKFIRLVGEFTSEQKHKFFKSYFKNAYFYFDLGAMEARGSTALRCDYLNRNFSPRFYHPKKDFVYEIINEVGNVLSVGANQFSAEPGELVLTSLFEGPFPLIRYRTGESAALSLFDCKCGRSQLLELYGRIGYDFFRVGGVTLYRHFIEEAINTIFNDHFIGDYELHVYEEIYNNKLVPKLVLKIAAKINNPLLAASRFNKNLKVGSNLYLDSLVNQVLFAPTEIQQVSDFKKALKKVKIISHLK